MNDITQTSKQIIGRLAERPYQSGDPLPAVGSLCLVSGANRDVASDQHRSYSWRKVIGYANDRQFVCLQTRDCWPTVERVANCWFAEIPTPAVPIRRKFDDLPIGTRFRYIGYSDVYVKLEGHDCGLVARWDGPNANALTQQIFTFADAPAEARAKEVEVVEHE